jgi:hypothetical protein
MTIRKTEANINYYTHKYEKLAKPASQEKGHQIAKEFLRYAGYMEGNWDRLGGDKSPGYEAVRWKGYLIKSYEIDEWVGFSQAQEIKNIILRLNGLGFQEDSNGKFYDPKTGTIFHMVYDVSDKKSPEIVLCFEGLGCEEHLDVSRKIQKKVGQANLSAAVREFMGGLPKASLQAMELGKILKEECEKGKLKPVVIGHSHGGGIAQAAAAAAGIKGVAFNSRPLGAKVRKKIGKEVLQENAQNITAFAGKHDWLTRIKLFNKTASILRKTLKIPLPRTIGKGYDLPKAENRPKEENRFSFHHASYYEQLHRLLRQKIN